MRRIIRGSVLATACALFCACGSSDPLPDPLVLATSSPSLRLVASTKGALSFQLERDGVARVSSHSGAGASRAALAFAVAQSFSPARYYDPEAADAEPNLVWHSAETIRSARREGAAVVYEVALSPGPGTATVRLGPSDTLAFALDVAPKDTSGTVVFTRLGFVAPAGPLYGGGESFTSVDGRGAVWPMQMRADGSFVSGTNERHVPIPFVADKRGGALLVHDLHPGAFDNAKTTEGRIELTFAATSLRAHLIGAATTSGAVEALARLTGMPRLPPRWAFAPLQWRNEHRDMAEVLEDARAMRALRIPAGVVWIDNPWSTGYSTFDFNTTKYPAPAAAIAELRALGYRVLLWTCPYFDASDDSERRPGMNDDNQALFETARQNEQLVKFADSRQPLTVPWGWGSGASVDFSGSAGFNAWRDLAAKVTAIGVAGFKLDYGEETVPELLGTRLGLLFANGETEATMHRKHSVGFHQATGAAFSDRNDAFLLGRASALGGQRDVDAIWPGDLDTDFSAAAAATRHVGGLRGALSGALSLALSGFPSYGSDIGGYRQGAPTEELLLRWAAMQAPLTIMQLGGGGDHHNPWLPPYTAAAVDAYRKLARLHIDLYPYLYELAKRASHSGTPYLLPPAALFPDDARLDTVTDAFMLGDRLYAAPVLDAGGAGRKVRLPPGKWMEVREALLGRFVHEGGREIDVLAAPGELPLFLKVGSALLLGMPDVVTLTDGADPGVKSGAHWQGRARVLWAPDLSVVPAAGEEEAAVSFAGETASVRVGTRTLLLPSGTREALLEIALPPGATPAVSLEVNGQALAPDAASEPASCLKCARWDPAGTLTVGLRGDAGVRLNLR